MDESSNLMIIKRGGKEAKLILTLDTTDLTFPASIRVRSA